MCLAMVEGKSLKKKLILLGKFYVDTPRFGSNYK